MRLSFKVLQAQQHDLSRVLKQSGSVLLLAFLHPVAVDAEGAAVDEFADAAEGVGISGQHLPGQRPSPAVAAVHPDAGQHADNQHLRGRNRRIGDKGRIIFPRLEIFQLNIKKAELYVLILSDQF